ncbi:MAG: hypothetical protein NTW68_02960 [candidate division NC10 bacterium]|nr:hypothetical protein [candidate division NC10 bacterium]
MIGDLAKKDKVAAQEPLPLQAGSAGHGRVEANPACRTWQLVSRLLNNPISLRLLKKVQMQGGARWAE